MRLPLHIKTTFLASAMILIAMILTFGLFAGTIVNRLQEDQMNYAEAQAENLAEKISAAAPSNHYELILDTVSIFNNARINRDEKDVIRVWEVANQGFAKRITTAHTIQDTGISQKTQNALFAGQEVKEKENLENDLVFRVFVPLRANNQTIGAVEYSEQLDTFFSLSKRYLLTGFVLSLVFMTLVALAIYELTGYFIYRPLKKLTEAMHLAKQGNLESRVKISGKNEFGSLAEEFNLMLAEIEDFSIQRERQNEILEDKVTEATAELTSKNSQLERANAEIWAVTSRLSDYEKLAAAGQTAAEFAHEVGTPLNLISGHIQLLRMKHTQEDEAAVKKLDLIAAQIKRIEKIVRRMLDRTRFGETELTPLSVNNVLENVAEIVAPKLTGEHIAVLKELDGDLPMISGNSEHLQQVFLNLINNAADAMPTGGELKIRTYLAGSEPVAEISDTGCGMDEATCKRIFEPLFTTKERGHGTGLGLVIVRQILHEQNARITVESAPGAGTAFKVFFPAAEGQASV